MDPFIETSGVWEDFHRRFLDVAAETLLSRLPPGYDARMNEYFQLINIAGEEPDQKRYPDVAVTRQAAKSEAPPAEQPAVGTLEPVVLTHRITWDEESAAWLEIQAADGELVTVVELLSPVNKTGGGYQKYVERRDGFLSRGVSLVEIDLLLRGKRLQFDSALPEGDCYVYFTRGDKPTSTAVYRWRLAAPLPVVPVPLRPPDPDVELDLAAVFSTTYDRGRYERRLKYKSPESSGLEGGNLAWAKSVLASSSI
jgi:hypothetical protein